jgi:inositol-1,4,5-trisphosphate 5-phosphatase
MAQFLTSKDQLLQEAERGQVFDGYCEGTLTFKPTYKYDVGSSNYDTSYKVTEFSLFSCFFDSIDG